MVLHKDQLAADEEEVNEPAQAEKLNDHLRKIVEEGRTPLLYVGAKPENKKDADRAFTIRGETREEAMRILDDAIDLLPDDDAVNEKIRSTLIRARDDVFRKFDVYHSVLTDKEKAEKIIERMKKNEGGLRDKESPEVIAAFERLYWPNRREFSEAVRYETESKLLILKELNETHEKVRELLQENEQDGLTPEAYNKKTMPRKVAESLIDCETRSGVYVFLDLNNFKAFNDGRTYALADEALKEFVRVLHSEGIMVGRLGGDEFSCFFPDEVNSEKCIHRIAGLYERAMKELDFGDEERPKNAPKYTDLHAGYGASIIALGDKDEKEQAIKRVHAEEQVCVKLLHETKNDWVKATTRHPYMLEGETYVKSATGERKTGFAAYWSYAKRKFGKMFGFINR